MYNINVSDERSYSMQFLAIFKLFDHGVTEGGTRAIPIGARAPKNWSDWTIEGPWWTFFG